MKKLVLLAIIAVVALSFTAAFAQDAPAPAAAPAPEAKPAEAAPAASGAADKLVKLYEKWYVNSIVSMETATSKEGTKEIMIGTAYFKDMDNFRADAEVQGQKMRMVHAGGQMWIYLEAQNTILKMSDPKEVEKASPKKDIEELKDKDTTVTEGKEGDNTAFTVVKKDKTKKVLLVNAKDVLVKETKYDEKGTVTDESTFKEWKFEPVKDEMFKKPEGAKEVDMNNPAPQPEEPKKEEPKKEETK